MSVCLNCVPESQTLLVAYRTAAAASIVACTGFGVFVLKKRLLRTTLAQQVLFLCLSDLLVVCWEELACPSLLHGDYCVDLSFGNVHLLFPLLRTLQISSVLWITLIALGLTATVHGKLFSLPCCMHVVWPLAFALCLPHWIVALLGSNRCWPDQMPEIVFMVEVILLLAVVLVAYVDALLHIRRLSTLAVLQRSLYRILHYVLIFLIFYVPYIVTQVLTSYTTRCLWNHEGQPMYFVVYLLYYLVGAANVSAYGWNHWDGGWRSEHRVDAANARRTYVVRILEDPSFCSEAVLSPEVSPQRSVSASPQHSMLEGHPSIADNSLSAPREDQSMLEDQVAAAFQQNYGPASPSPSCIIWSPRGSTLSPPRGSAPSSTEF